MKKLPLLYAEDAVAAILLDNEGRYLLQLRDKKPDIFFPGQWSLFGGAIDHGETPYEALCREVAEELDLDISDAKLFGRFEYDLSPVGKGSIFRQYYEFIIPENMLKSLIVYEGQRAEFFTANQLSDLKRLVCYDAHALWLHAEQDQVIFPAQRNQKNDR